MEQVQFRGIDTTLDHNGGNNNALSHGENARTGKDVAQNGNFDADGSSSHREISRRVHTENVHKMPRGVQKLTISSILCY